MILRPKGRPWQPGATHSCHVKHTPEQPAAPFGEFGLALPLSTLLDFDIHASVGDHLVEALETCNISQFRTQNGHGFCAKFGHSLQAFGVGVASKQLLNLLFELCQMDLKMLHVFTPDRAPLSARASSARSLLIECSANSTNRLAVFCP
jgi:hypothetical protein